MGAAKVKTASGWEYISTGPPGEPGPPGPPGPAGAVYTHHQGPASAHWVVDHNLGFNPNIIVIDSAGSIVEGEIVYTNSNSLNLDFSGAFSGVAYLS
jgi:hypothetical protein